MMRRRGGFGLVRPFARECLAVVMLLTGCGHGTSGPPSDQGFYRHGDESTVFYVQPAAKTYCIVANPSMMEAYGGFTQVHVVGHDVDVQAAGTLTGSCRWPVGFYRKVDSDVVYQVRAADVCRVAPARPGPKGGPTARPKVAARIVSSDADVLVGLPFAGNCT